LLFKLGNGDFSVVEDARGESSIGMADGEHAGYILDTTRAA
jgi:hypothetical protein